MILLGGMTCATRELLTGSAEANLRELMGAHGLCQRPGALICGFGPSGTDVARRLVGCLGSPGRVTASR